MSSHLLTTQEREDIFNRIILLNVQDQIKPKENPKGIILGGQPGSGKSTFITLLKKLNSDAIAINGDDLRHFHPNYRKLLTEEEEHASNLTQADCNEWVEKLIDFTSSHKADIIVEGTMRRPEVPVRTADLMAERGYRTEAIAISVPPEISWASSLYRFEMQKKLIGLGRFTKPEGHNESLAGISSTLKAIHDSSHFIRLSLYSRREGEYLKEYDNEKIDEVWKSTENAADVFNRIISREMNQKELRYTLGLLNESVRTAHLRGADKNYVEYLLELSRPIREKLVDTYPEIKNEIKLK